MPLPKVIRQLTWLGLILVAMPSVSLSMDQTECKNRLQSVDERIASGKYSAGNVATAEQIRDSIMQNCAYLTEDMLEPMMEGFEQLLPTRTEEERQAYEQARREERKAEVEARREEREAQRAERARIKQERAEKQQRDKLPVSPVLLQPTTGKSTLVKLIERPDNMQQAQVVDWDFLGGTMRMLYRSYPLARQEGSASAVVRFYVVLAGPDGRVDQHEVGTFPYDGLVRGALRRGHPEVVFQRPGELTPKPESTLERRSVPDGTLLSTAKLPDLGWTELSWGESLFFRSVLDDGNLLFAGHPTSSVASSSSKAAAGNTLAWAAVSPSGSIERRGSYAEDRTNINLNDWVVLPNNGLTYLIYASLADHSASGIPSDLDTPIRETFGGIELQGFVASEFRLLSTNSASGAVKTSAGFDRIIDWKGRGAGLQPGSMADREEASMRLLAVARSHGAGQKVRSSLARIGDRAGILINQLTYTAPDPQADGYWLHEYADNELVRQTHLQSAADHLAVSFSHLAGAGPDSVYAYGLSSRNEKAYVIRLNADREISAYAEASFVQGHEFISMFADESGVWIIWWQRDSQNKQVPAIERVSFTN